jgi:hypothetical protein
MEIWSEENFTYSEVLDDVSELEKKSFVTLL